MNSAATVLINKLEAKIADSVALRNNEVNTCCNRIMVSLNESIDKWDGIGHFRCEYTVNSGIRLDVLELLRKMIGSAFTLWSDQGCVIVQSKKTGIADERAELNTSK
jgi:hypothetical protein